MLRGQNPPGVIVLAAGQGKRMRSSIPKVLHEIGGKPLIFHVLHQVKQALPQAPVALVVGHGKELIDHYIKNEKKLIGMEITFIHQPEQNGTGGAVRCVMDSPWGEQMVRDERRLLVLPGDLPLIQKDLLEGMAASLSSSEAARLLVCDLANPTGYGRVVREKLDHSIQKIVEERDATPDEKLIREVAVSIYCFDAEFLKDALSRVSNQNAQGEFYLTDTIGIASEGDQTVSPLVWHRQEDLRGVNDLWELSEAAQILNLRWIKHWALQGVKIIHPAHTYLDFEVELHEGVVIHPGAKLAGATRIGKGSIIGQGVVLENVVIEEDVTVKTGTVAEDSWIGRGAQVGPYAHLRPGSRVGAKAKIGNFVELKKSTIGEGTSIAHLSYLGDAEVGRNVNIGCGFVTCNFDGRVIDGERKHKTIIEDEVFLGSDCQAVAPITIGKGAYVASGSTLTQNVDSGDLAIARSRQVNKRGYAQKYNQKYKKSPKSEG